MIILAGGVFDPFHWGHLKYLEEAASLKRPGDQLWVAVTADQFVNKGPFRPVFNDQQRLEVIQALRIVDHAFITTSGMAAVEEVRPGIYVKGSEYKGKLPEQEYVERIGGKVHFTGGLTYSSTELLGYFSRVSGNGEEPEDNSGRG